MGIDYRALCGRTAVVIEVLYSTNSRLKITKLVSRPFLHKDRACAAAGDPSSLDTDLLVFTSYLTHLDTWKRVGRRGGQARGRRGGGLGWTQLPAGGQPFPPHAKDYRGSIPGHQHLGPRPRWTPSPISSPPLGGRLRSGLARVRKGLAGHFY